MSQNLKLEEEIANLKQLCKNLRSKEEESQAKFSNLLKERLNKIQNEEKETKKMLDEFEAEKNTAK